MVVLGCGYVLVAMILGHVHVGNGGDAGGHVGHGGDAGHGDGGDASGHDASGEHYGLGSDGHGSASTGAATLTAFHFPFFSPLALATIIGATGAYGLIAKTTWRASDLGSLLVALPAAVVTAYAVTYVAWRLVMSSRGSSQIRLAELAGARAEVITPIPAGGIGEVAAMVQSQRYNAPAREAHGREVARGTIVIVEGLVGTTLVVRKPL
jgi:membrane protein implicated in regulation of membrane protease activity